MDAAVSRNIRRAGAAVAAAASMSRSSAATCAGPRAGGDKLRPVAAQRGLKQRFHGA